MDSARQILRFSIPGSVFLLWSTLGGIIVRVIIGDSLDSATQGLRENVAAAVAVLSSIPVGFVLYQTYYVFYRPFVLFPHRWGGTRWARLDRGAAVLENFTPEQREGLGEIFGTSLDARRVTTQSTGFPYLRLLELDDWYVKEITDMGGDPHDTYRRRWYTNWDVLRAVIEVSDASEATRGIKREYVTLSDLYHALGATRTAIQGAWICVFVGSGAAMVALHEHVLTWAAGIALFSFPSLALLGVLHQTRRNTWKSAAMSLVYGLRWVFDNHPGLFEPAVSEAPAEGGTTIFRLRARVRDAVDPLQ